MSGRRILVVEDNSDVALFLTRLLQRAGYTVLTAQDAIQAVMQAHREAPDLILTDLAMPAGGGFTILDQLARPATSTGSVRSLSETCPERSRRVEGSKEAGAIPIIVLTGADDPEVEARALAAGAIRVLPKPCDNAVLLECIKTALGEEC